MCKRLRFAVAFGCDSHLLILSWGLDAIRSWVWIRFVVRFGYDSHLLHLMSAQMLPLQMMPLDLLPSHLMPLVAVGWYQPK